MAWGRQRQLPACLPACFHSRVGLIVTAFRVVKYAPEPPMESAQVHGARTGIECFGPDAVTPQVRRSESQAQRVDTKGRQGREDHPLTYVALCLSASPGFINKR